MGEGIRSAARHAHERGQSSAKRGRTLNGSPHAPRIARGGRPLWLVLVRRRGRRGLRPDQARSPAGNPAHRAPRGCPAAGPDGRIGLRGGRERGARGAPAAVVDLPARQVFDHERELSGGGGAVRGREAAGDENVPHHGGVGGVVGETIFQAPIILHPAPREQPAAPGAVQGQRAAAVAGRDERIVVAARGRGVAAAGSARVAAAAAGDTFAARTGGGDGVSTTTARAAFATGSADGRLGASGRAGHRKRRKNENRKNPSSHCRVS